MFMAVSCKQAKNEFSQLLIKFHSAYPQPIHVSNRKMSNIWQQMYVHVHNVILTMTANNLSPNVHISIKYAKALQ